MTTFRYYYDNYIRTFIKEAAKVRTDRIPKGSIIAKEIAKKYWDAKPKNPDSIDRKLLRDDIEARINKAQYADLDKQDVHRVELSTIYDEAVEAARKEMQRITAATTGLPLKDRQEIINKHMSALYTQLQTVSKKLKNYTRSAYTAENTRQLLLKQVPKKVRKYLRDLPITIGSAANELYNDQRDLDGSSTLGFYNSDEGRAHVQTNPRQGVATVVGHEVDGHGGDYAHTNADAAHYARGMSYNKNERVGAVTKAYTFKNKNKNVYKRVPDGTMMTESIAATTPVQHMKQVVNRVPKKLKKLGKIPRKLSKRLAKNYELQSNRAYNVYNNKLNTRLPARKETAENDIRRVGEIIDKDVNSLAKLNEISARKELDAVPADRAYNIADRKRPIVSTMLELGKVRDSEIEPMRNMLNQGFKGPRKQRKEQEKIDKQKRIQEIADRREKLNIRQTTNIYDREQWQKAHPEEYARQQAMLNKTSFYKLFYNMFRRTSCNS